MKTTTKRLTLAAAILALATTSSASSLCVDASDMRCFSTIQAAVDNARPGDEIKIEAGTYPETVVVPVGLDGIKLKGAKKPSEASSAGIKPRAGCATIDAIGNTNGDVSALEIRSANVTVENLCVINGAGDGIHFGCDDGTGGCDPDGDNAPNAVMKNVWVSGVGDDCIDVEDDGAVLTNFRTLNCGDKCISWNGDDSVIADGLVRGCQDHGVNLNTSNNARVSNLEVANTWDSTDTSEFACIRARGDNIYIADSFLHSCGADGILRERGVGGTIANNTIIGVTRDGLHIESDGVTVEGNVIAGADDDGIDVEGNNVRLVGNQIKSAADEGIDFLGDDAIIADNRIASSASFGIQADTFRSSITGNTVGFADSDGIEVLGDDNVISFNTVEAAGFQAIDISGDRMVVTDNTVEISQADGIEVDCFDCTGVRVMRNTVNGTVRFDAECFDIDSNGSAGLMFVDNVARFCGEDGVQLQGTVITARGNTVTDSGTRPFHPGFNVFANGGGGHVLENNVADRNFNDGFNVDGNDMVFRNNSASCNGASGFGVDTFGSAEDAVGLVYDGNSGESNNRAGLETRTGTTATVSNNTTDGNAIGFCDEGSTVDGGGNDFADGSASGPGVCPAE